MQEEIDLGPELEAFIAHVVATGRFASAHEVFCEGVRLIQERELNQSRHDRSSDDLND